MDTTENNRHSWILPEHPITKLPDREKTKTESAITIKNYMILDAACWERIIHTAFRLATEYVNLFSLRKADQDLEKVSPYLFRYEPDDKLSSWVERHREEGLNVLYLRSTLEIEALRRHLRRFLRIKQKNGKWFLLRFYDVVVMQNILPYLTSEQQAAFLSELESISFYDIKTKEYKVVTSDTEKTGFTRADNVPIGSNWLFSEEQIEKISMSIFSCKAFCELSVLPDCRRIPHERLEQLITSQTQTAISFRIMEEQYIYDYILLTIKYPILQEHIPEDIRFILQKDIPSYEKLVETAALLHLNTYYHAEF